MMPRLCSLLALAAISVITLVLLLDCSQANKWRQKGQRASLFRRSTSFREIIKLINEGRNKKNIGTRKTKPTTIPITISTDSVKVLNARIKIHNGKTDQKQQFVPPQVLNKLRRVSNLRDFIKEFHPEGVSVKTRVVTKSAAKPSVDSVILSSDGGGGSAFMATRQEEEEVLQFDSSSPLRSSSESNEIVQPSTGMVTQRCEIKEFIREVPVEQGFHGIMFPSCVRVNECSGCCINTLYMECAALRVQVIPQIAFKVSYSVPTRALPVPINVTHHTQCGCRCKVKESDCLQTQTYSASNCQCECPKAAQLCPILKAWHPVQCTCKCSYPRDCKSRRRYWDEETCTCACKKEPCPARQFRNLRTCACTPVEK